MAVQKGLCARNLKEYQSRQDAKVVYVVQSQPARGTSMPKALDILLFSVRAPFMAVVCTSAAGIIIIIIH